MGREPRPRGPRVLGGWSGGAASTPDGTGGFYSCRTTTGSHKVWRTSGRDAVSYSSSTASRTPTYHGSVGASDERRGGPRTAASQASYSGSSPPSAPGSGPSSYRETLTVGSRTRLCRGN